MRRQSVAGSAVLSKCGRLRWLPRLARWQPLRRALTAPQPQGCCPSGPFLASEEMGNTDPCACQAQTRIRNRTMPASTPTTVAGASSRVMRSSHNIRIGSKASFPESIAQQDGFRRIPFAFIRRKQPAQVGLHAKQRKKVLRYRQCVQSLGFSMARSACCRLFRRTRSRPPYPRTNDCVL